MPHAPLSPHVYDLAVIGGGINGVGIATDAAGRGLSVFLCEQHDLANHTSSASSKLIHGGLRYLEHYEFRLVHEALAEREVLLRNAPHIVKALRFILPHRPHLRPAWMIRAGLFLYDHLGKRKQLGASRHLRFDPQGPLTPSIREGFEYADCWVDDARLVICNAIAARERGADIRPRTRCLSAKRHNGLWQLQMQPANGSVYEIYARTLVNAAGPWVAQVFEQLQLAAPYKVRLIQGSHIIVPRLHEGAQAYILQNQDRRIVFVIPYLEHFSLIGTTDQPYHDDPAQVSITETEIDYLLDIVNTHFCSQISRDDVQHSFAGVRPLCDDESSDPSAVTRDYTLALLAEPQQAPLLSVFGGKLTTYRKLAEAALTQLQPFFPNMGAPWTADAKLPGAQQQACSQTLSQDLQNQHPWLPAKLIARWVRSYGDRTIALIADASALSNLGEHFGAGLFQREVDYLCEHEWAISAEDILWRRSKLGLFMLAQEQATLSLYLAKVAAQKT